MAMRLEQLQTLYGEKLTLRALLSNPMMCKMTENGYLPKPLYGGKEGQVLFIENSTSGTLEGVPVKYHFIVMNSTSGSIISDPTESMHQISSNARYLACVAIPVKECTATNMQLVYLVDIENIEYTMDYGEFSLSMTAEDPKLKILSLNPRECPEWVHFDPTIEEFEMRRSEMFAYLLHLRT